MRLMLKVQENYTKNKIRKDKNIQTSCPKMISANTRGNDQNKQMQRTS